MVPTEWSRLLCLVGRRKRMSEWKALFGGSFRLFEACLLKTGDHVRAIDCPLCSCNHEVLPDKGGNGFVAHCRCDDRGCEDIRLTRQMAEAWELSGEALGETLGRALGVSTGFGVHSGERGLFDLGECPRHSERAHVWLCAGSERMQPEMIADLFKRKGVGCVVAANRDAALPSLLANAGVTIISVDTAFTCANDGIRGDCQQRCRTGVGVSVDRTTLVAIHADIRQIKDIAAPLPAAVAKVDKGLETVQKHVRGVPFLQAELAEAKVVPEALAVEIHTRIADILTPEEQAIWHAMRKAGGSQKNALPSLRQSGVVNSAPVLSRRVRAINPKLLANNLPACDAPAPAVTFTKHGGFVGKDGDEVPEELSVVERDWAKDPAERDTTVQSYLTASPEDKEYFHQTKPGIQEEADKYLKRRRRN